MSNLENILRSFVQDGTPYNRYLGMRLVSVAAGEATCALPGSRTVVGDPDTGTVHGGDITAVVDVASGAAVCMQLGRLQGIATLELRIDFLRPVRDGQPIVARAHCYKIAGATAFVRVLAYDEVADDPVASAQGTFMLVDV